MHQLIYVGRNKYSIKQLLPENVIIELLITRHLCLDESMVKPNCLLLIEAIGPAHSNIDWIKAFKNKWPSVPILILSDAMNEWDMRKYYRAGVRDYIAVPEEERYLTTLVETLFQYKVEESKFKIQDSVHFPLEEIEILEKDVKSTDKALIYIHTNYQKRISVDYLANICFMHPHTFARKFKDEQGCTVRDYLKNYRINAAMQLLRKTKLTIENIAFKVGFETISLFNRLFKQITGVSPSAYRKLIFEFIH